jgi:CCR4-NOT transcription complex subunit 9
VLLELSKKRESFPDLAPILWHSVGTIAALLQEIVSIYTLLTPPTLTAHASNRVCNALALLQCVASHIDTRTPFLNAQIPLYLYPFLNTVSKSRPFEYLRLTSLGVIGALVKVDDIDVISFLLSTEIIPLCLRIMETGSELSKTVATFIVQKILLEETGLNYVCATAERFYAVATVLANMVSLLQIHPSVRLLKHVVRCYLRLADHPRAREALKTCLPSSLRDNTFHSHLHNDITVQKWLSQLLNAVGGNGNTTTATNNNSGGSGGTVATTTTTSVGSTTSNSVLTSNSATAATSSSSKNSGMTNTTPTSFITVPSANTTNNNSNTNNTMTTNHNNMNTASSSATIAMSSLLSGSSSISGGAGGGINLNSFTTANNNINNNIGILSNPSTLGISHTNSTNNSNMMLNINSMNILDGLGITTTTTTNSNESLLSSSMYGGGE